MDPEADCRCDVISPEPSDDDQSSDDDEPSDDDQQTDDDEPYNPSDYDFYDKCANITDCKNATCASADDCKLSCLKGKQYPMDSSCDCRCQAFSAEIFTQ